MGLFMVRDNAFRMQSIFSKGSFLAVLLGSAAIRWYHLGTQSFWFDETYTAYVAGQTPDHMMQFLIADGVHPPLYYWFMAVWIRIFGTGEWVLRFPSALSGVLSVLCLYLLVRKIAGKSEAILAAVLLGISPFAVWYSQDARMYSMVCLAAVTAVFFFWNVLEKITIKNILGLILSHAALYGLHYFGVFILLAEFCFLILFWRKYKGRWLPFILAQILAMIPLVIWGQLLLQRVNGSFGIGWIPKPDGMDLLSTISNFHFANGGIWDLRSIAGMIVIILLFGLALRQRELKEAVWFGIFWFFLPILSVWAISQNLPVYIDRYMIFSLPASVLLISLGANSLQDRKKFLLPGMLICLMLTGLWNMNVPTAMYRKEEWRQAAEYIRRQYQPNDLLLLRVYQEVVPLQYYGLLDLDWTAIETNRIITLPEIGKSVGKCFLVYWLPSQSAHTFGTAMPNAYSENDPLVEDWLDRHLQQDKNENGFNGVMVIIMKPAEEGS
jgi:4-amino-4-deoxy-L-arabinose transferase-like glycosyltransferase